MTRRLGIAVAAAAVLSLALPAQATTSAVAINGSARAAAVFVPFAVNPNFDFWPVYAASETDASASHGLAAGFWPGFLVDATFFQFGYQPAERAFFGVAESLWPNEPHHDAAATSDFARLCAAGEVSRVPLPADGGDAGFPEPMLTGCQTMWAQYHHYLPASAASGQTSSDRLLSEGLARGARLDLGNVSVGQARARSITDGRDETGIVSRALVVMRDLRIGEGLVIGELRSEARASAGEGAPEASHRIELLDVTFQGEAAVLDEDGLRASDGTPLDDALAEQGIEVFVSGGGATVGEDTARADAGALVVRYRRDGPPSEMDAGYAGCEALEDLQPEPATQLDERVAGNPLHDQRPPYDQLPPEVRVSESVPPPLPCPLLLLERAVDVGVALGGASAAARAQPLGLVPPGTPGGTLPPPPAFEPPVVAPGAPGGGGAVPSLPSFGEVPPVPREVFTAGPGDLGEAVAARVRQLYAGLFLMLAAGLLGRRGLRSLVFR